MDQYKERRETILSHMPDNTAIIITGAQRQHQSEDQYYAFRQTGDFYYLTGWVEPDSILVLIKQSSTRTILFHAGENAHDQRWHGKNISHGDAIQVYGFNQAEPRSEFEHWLAQHQDDFDRVYTYATQDTATYNRTNSQSGRDIINSWISGMRVVKTEQELRHMRRACSITAQAHRLTMEAAAQSLFTCEREIAATFQYHSTMLGADCLAYDTIAASNDNACILHYTHNNQFIESDSFMLLDAGASVKGYAADVTRSWPNSGKFNREQSIIYDIVHEAHHVCLSMLKSGMKMSDIQNRSQTILYDGLVEHNIIENSSDPGDVFKAFYGHGVGHSLGLDVHDPSPPRDKFVLAENMVITLEPGLYITNHKLLKDNRFLGIGVRIEDNCLIKQNGAEILTEEVPTKRSEIELLMRKQ